VDQAIAALRDRVVEGVWQVGVRLPSEPVLAAELGVGRSTLREAVRALSHAGVLEVRQGSGTFVRAAPAAAELAVRLQRAQALEVYEVRRALEVEAAATAAKRRTKADLERIDAALERREAARAAGLRAAMLAADLEFHRAVVEAAHNPLLSELYAAALSSISRAIEDVVGDRALTEDTSGLHQELAAAVRRRDSAAAVAAVRAHLDGTHRALAALVDR
jgi:DNA-binding FadR family transcriptional regulator